MRDVILKLRTADIKRLLACLDYSFVIPDKSEKLLFGNRSFKKHGYSIDSIILDYIDLGKLEGKTEKEKQYQK